MPNLEEQIGLAEAAASRDRQSVNKSMLALDALSNLTNQFANKPDFHQLIDGLILTISGQFSVADAFAVIRKPGAVSGHELVFTTGRFRREKTLSAVEKAIETDSFFLAQPSPCSIDHLVTDDSATELGAALSDIGVEVVAPLVHGETFMGIIGLGPKVVRKPFEDADIDLLATLANTITPLIANSFLFMEIASLNAWYLEILSNVKHGVFVFGADSHLKTVNAAGINILKDVGNTETRAVALRGASLRDIFNEQTYPGWQDFLSKAARQSTGPVIESLLASSGENERLFNVGVSTISRDDDTLSDLIVTLDDVTAQKESEQRLFDLEKFADKGVMASSISHELNNFLGLILGGVELAQFAAGKGDADKAADSLEKVKDSISKMKRFTSGLMDFTRLETTREPARLNTIVSDVLSFATVQKRFVGVTVQTELDPDLPVIDIDIDQVAQLLLNMLNNAVDAIVEAETDPGLIVVSTFRNHDSAGFSISDNGIGIPPEVKDKLFQSRLTTKEKGHGFGLVTCAKIIENHKGRIDIDSTPGRGTTFNISFPF